MDFEFKSDPINGPIREMSLMRRSLLFAELAWIAYRSEESAQATVSKIGMKETLFFERDGSQAYMFGTEHDCIVACRGTEPTEWNDISADLNAIFCLAETVGKVHSGFKNEVDDLWPIVEQRLKVNEKTLWFTGHSLGGAMATICAGRCFLSHIPSTPEQVFTFGSPRVGNRRYVNNVDLDHIRWVNNNDIVTRVPPSWMGYRHTGQEMYFNAHGALRQMTKWQRSKDRWRGMWMGLKQGKVDHFSDHSMDGYIANVYRATIEDEENQCSKKAKVALNKAATKIEKKQVAQPALMTTKA